MIRYTLKCAEGHEFESWFQSANAFDALAEKDLVSCSVCGSDQVSKALMAPRVNATEDAPLRAPVDPAQAAMKARREQVEKNSTYVGGNFAREARAMHLGDVPERAIHGEAKPDEAKALIEDGVPILPIPGGPPEKTN